MKWIHLVFVFLFGVFTIFFLYVGLPFDFSSDLVDHEKVFRGMSYGKLVSLTLNPLTPSWFFMNEIGYLRPIYYLIQKAFFDFFGPFLQPFHVAVALGHGAFLASLFFSYGKNQRAKIVRLVALSPLREFSH